jgi:hypothetical protein
MLSDWISLRTVLMAGFSAPCSLAASPVSTDNAPAQRRPPWGVR